MPPAAPTRRRLAGSVALALPALGAAYLATLVATDARVAPLPDPVEAAVARGARYLVRHCGPDGRFAYLVSPDGPRDTPEYNVLRHAGSIYGLGHAYSLVPEPETLDAMRRAARYLASRHVAVVRGRPDLAAVFSLPGEETGGPRVAKLGGAALGIVALAELRRLDPEAVPVPLLQGLGRFLVFMMGDDGKFVSKFTESGGYDRTFDSLYYPGEAILALTRLYDVDGDPRWLEVALRAADWLERSRRGTPWWRLVSDHWLLIATAPLVDRIDAVPSPAIDRRRLLAHGRDLGRKFLWEQWKASWVPTLRGSFNDLGRTTPSATRVEGLVALHAALPDGDPLRPVLRRAVAHGAGFLMATQAGADRGAIADGFRAALHGWPGSDRFNRSVEVVRIDYVQHALSALVGHQGIDRAAR